MDQVVCRLTFRDGCATPRAATAQPWQFEGRATKRNHSATARNHGATDAQPLTEDRSATAQPAAYKQPVRLRVPGKRKGSSNSQGTTAVGPRATRKKRFSRRSGLCGFGPPRSGWLATIFSRGTTTTRVGDQGPMKNLFWINKAADLLEGDRATVVRALRLLKADGELRGQRIRKPVAPGGGLETGLQSPENRTGWDACTGTKFPNGGSIWTAF